MTWIHTASGGKLDFINPDPAQINIRDIAVGLSNTCRFSGQIPNNRWYSVAEHSINCALTAERDGLSPKQCLAILMHDASEAYLCDLSRPLKSLVPQYRDIENRIQEAIGQRFGINFDDYHEVIKKYDNEALFAEKNFFFPGVGEWDGERETRTIKLIYPRSVLANTTKNAARMKFLVTFKRFSKKKILIVGHKGHGKDTLADLMSLYGYKKQDSSRKALEIFLFQKLRDKYGYATPEEAYQDREQHRAEWYQEIVAFNTPDKTRLARLIMQDSDIYVGMRDRDEIDACMEAGIFDYVIWVDASQRKPLESKSSFNIEVSPDYIVVDNNGDESDLRDAAAALYEIIEGRSP